MSLETSGKPAGLLFSASLTKAIEVFKNYGKRGDKLKYKYLLSMKDAKFLYGFLKW
jgi:hypothetical protein